MLEDIIYVANINENTIVDGEGFRTSLYVSGCDIKCEGCHNKSLWDMQSGSPMTIDEVYEKLTKGFTHITFIGGEPMMQAAALSKLAEKIKINTCKTIWIYSGHIYEELIKNEKSLTLLKNCDVLVDGPFDRKYYENNLRFKGSTNQRIINLKKSLESNKAVLWQDEFDKF
ncbi:MAG: anaerobic ribonucleoside-triphosphate reductase activating protein [Sedimentibacter sp.]|uniref:anaerobic ribonucleoside-triphosphate reductase activating protein n=1 Tax=Sedimentibacter sp. TaxID=1960295 RepID=UPI00315882B9